VVDPAAGPVTGGSVRPRRGRRLPWLVPALAAGLVASAGPAGAQQIRTGEEVTMRKLTPVILVEEIEPCLPFWEDRLGFERTMQVPEGDRLGFAAVAKGGVEVMYQSRASVLSDVPALGAGPFGKDGFGLFIEVEDLDPVLAALEGAEVLFPERRTFYGAREIGVRAPCGTAVTFAEFEETEGG
jgi:uncharacterized glyoxalase superfamily protein PhnB